MLRGDRSLSIESFKTAIGDEEADVSARLVDTRIAFGDHLPSINQATYLLIEEAMKRSGGNQTEAARLLGISQQALSKRLQKAR